MRLWKCLFFYIGKNGPSGEVAQMYMYILEIR